MIVVALAGVVVQAAVVLVAAAAAAVTAHAAEDASAAVHDHARGRAMGMAAVTGCGVLPVHRMSKNLCMNSFLLHRLLDAMARHRGAQ